MQEALLLDGSVPGTKEPQKAASQFLELPHKGLVTVPFELQFVFGPFGAYLPAEFTPY